MGMEQHAKYVQLTCSAIKWALTVAKAALQIVPHRKVPQNWQTANVNLEIFMMALAHVTSTRLCEMEIALSAANCTCSAKQRESALPEHCQRSATLVWNPRPQKLAGVFHRMCQNVVLAVTSAAWGTVGHSVPLVQINSEPQEADVSTPALEFQNETPFISSSMCLTSLMYCRDTQSNP